MDIGPQKGLFVCLFLTYFLKIGHYYFVALYSCPYCEGSYHEWQQPLEERSQFPKRTLQNITTHYQQFCEDGERKERSKSISKSVVREPMLPIEPEDVRLH